MRILPQLNDFEEIERKTIDGEEYALLEKGGERVFVKVSEMSQPRRPIIPTVVKREKIVDEESTQEV